MGGLLTTLAKSGNQLVQLIIVLGVIVNTFMTNSNRSGIKENSQQLDKFRLNVARQVKSIYDNQNFLFDFVDETRAGLDKLQLQLGIPHPSVTPYPRQRLPEDLINLYPQPPPQYPWNEPQ